MRLPKTINVQVGKKFWAKVKEEIMTEVFKAFNLYGVKAIQVAYDVIRVTFSTEDGYRIAKGLTGVRLFGLWCPILGGGPPVTIVHVFDYPYEEENSHVSSVFGDFGEVKNVKNQTYLTNPRVFTGTRLVFMVLNSTLPRGLTINGYLCRVWYKGQPLVCNLCNVQGHKAAVCPNKDKCRRCGGQGHFARNCTKDLDADPASTADGSSVPAQPANVDVHSGPVSGEVQNDVQNVVPSDGNCDLDVDGSSTEENDDVESLDSDDGDSDSDDDFVEVEEQPKSPLNDLVIVRESNVENVDGASVDVSLNNGMECESGSGLVVSEKDGESNVESESLNKSVDIQESVLPVANDNVGDSSISEVNESSQSQSILDPKGPSDSISECAESSGSQSILDPKEPSDSISEFTESSGNQGILDPKGASGSFGARSLQGKAKSSVISKLLPRKQPVVRSGHHSLPVVVPSRPSLGGKVKKR